MTYIDNTYARDMVFILILILGCFICWFFWIFFGDPSDAFRCVMEIYIILRYFLCFCMWNHNSLDMALKNSRYLGCKSILSDGFSRLFSRYQRKQVNLFEAIFQWSIIARSCQLECLFWCLHSRSLVSRIETHQRLARLYILRARTEKFIKLLEWEGGCRKLLCSCWLVCGCCGVMRKSSVGWYVAMFAIRPGGGFWALFPILRQS